MTIPLARWNYDENDDGDMRVTGGPLPHPQALPAVHISDLGTVALPSRALLDAITESRLGVVALHRQEAVRLRRKASDLSESIADLTATANRMEDRRAELRGWTNLSEQEREQLAWLCEQLPRIRADLAHYRNERVALIAEANRHEAAADRMLAAIQAEG